VSVLNVTVIPQRIIARVVGPGLNTTAVINRAGAARVVLVGTQGVAGAASAGVDFPFLTPSTTWTINHNLGIRPAVQLRTVGHVVFAGDVEHPTLNQAVVTFVSPFAGYARCT
jgi:hypothetical protein